ncbi:MAG: hypothetical protein KTR19_02045 [Hyphomicrobiales bacterium]|nr:hypothetical protein [Hyphomicrobiales bacterium]
MKQLIAAAAFALAFTATASAYDGSSDYGYDSANAVEKPAYPGTTAGQDHNADIRVNEDPTPSKLKKDLQFFDQISQGD